MLYQGKVVDSDNGAALPSATISIDGRAVTSSDSNGNFSVDFPPDAATISASYVGYDPVTIPEEIFLDTGQISISKSNTALPEVSVVAKIKSNPLPYALAGGGLILLLMSGRKKRVSGIDTTTLLLIAGGALAVYLLMRKSATPPAYISPTAYPGYAPYLGPGNAGNPVAADISAGGAAASSILNAISNF